MIPTMPTSSVIPMLMPTAGLAGLLGPAASLALAAILAALLVLIIDIARVPRSNGHFPRDVSPAGGDLCELESSVRHAA